jgi:hypothetical protein
MHFLAELETQRKALLEKGEEVPSHMVEPSFEELMAGRVQPSPNETPKEKEKRISAFRVHGGVPGPQGLWCKRMGGGHVFHPTTADKLHGIR